MRTMHSHVTTSALLVLRLETSVMLWTGSRGPQGTPAPPWTHIGRAVYPNWEESTDFFGICEGPPACGWGGGGYATKAEQVRRLVLPGVRTALRLEGGEWSALLVHRRRGKGADLRGFGLVYVDWWPAPCESPFPGRLLAGLCMLPCTRPLGFANPQGTVPDPLLPLGSEPATFQPSIEQGCSAGGRGMTGVEGSGGDWQENAVLSANSLHESMRQTPGLPKDLGGVLARRAFFFFYHSPPVPVFAPPHQTIWSIFSQCLRIWPILCTQFMMMARVVVGSGGCAILGC